MPDVPEKELLARGGRKKVSASLFFDRRRQAFRKATDIIFGGDGETQFVFSRRKGEG